MRKVSQVFKKHKIMPDLIRAFLGKANEVFTLVSFLRSECRFLLIFFEAQRGA